MWLKFTSKLLTIAAFSMSALSASAAVLTANTGWMADTLSSRGAPTDSSPYSFTLGAGQIGSFKVTDQFVMGDSFDLYVNGSPLIALSSTAFAGTANSIVGDVFGENGWLNSGYEKFDYIFSTAGLYTFSVIGDGVGGIPAGLYVRLDVKAGTVPEPTSLALIGLGLAGLATARRRKAKQA